MLRQARAAARLEGTREELFAILTDYGRYAAWMPGVERSRVLVREGDVTVAEIEAPAWNSYPFNLELVRSPPDAVAYHQIDSVYRPAVSGRWDLGTTDPGVGASTVEVRATLRLETPLLGLASRRRVRAALRAALDALGARRRQLASGRRAEAVRRKLLEVVREDEGLRVWYLGETFLLPKADGGGE